MPPLPDAWKEVFEQLRRERDAALRQSEQLQNSIDRLAGMLASQNDRLDQIVAMLRRREAQLRRAEAEVRKLRRKLGLDDPDPDPVSAPKPEDESLPDPAPDPNAPPPGSGESAKRGSDRRRRSRGGRRPPPEHLPEVRERHDVCACAHCGGRVFKRDVLKTRVYTVVPSYVRCRTIERERVVCADPDCNKPTTAPMPPMPCDRALYDCRFLAWLVQMKFELLVPLDRIRLLLLSQGIDLSMGTLVHLIERAATLCDPIDGEHMKQLRAGTWMGFDGTGLKTLIVGQDKAWDGYLEVYTRDEITVFQFDLTKHADRLQRRLGDFTGILVCDAETRNAAGAPNATFANCNAHPRRKLGDAERVQPRLALQGARFIQALYEIEREADELSLAGAELVAFRQRRCPRVLYRFEQWLRGVIARDLPPSDPVRKAAAYYLAHLEDLTRFVDHDVPIDNNSSEREFQRHAKLRFASLFAGSPEGGHRWATLLGVVRTAEKCGLDVFEYLTWLFERRGSDRKRFAMAAADLTPMAYKASLRHHATSAA